MSFLDNVGSPDLNLQELFVQLANLCRQQLQDFHQALELELEKDGLGKKRLMEFCFRWPQLNSLTFVAANKVILLLGGTQTNMEDGEVMWLLCVCRFLDLHQMKPSRYIQWVLGDALCYLRLVQRLTEYMSRRVDFRALEVFILLDVQTTPPFGYLQTQPDTYASLLQGAWQIFHGKKEPEPMAISSALKQLANGTLEMSSSFAQALWVRAVFLAGKEKTTTATKSTPGAIRALLDRAESPQLARFILCGTLVNQPDHRETTVMQRLFNEIDLPAPQTPLEKLIGLRISLNVRATLAAEIEMTCDENLANIVDRALAVATCGFPLQIGCLLMLQLQNLVVCSLRRAQQLRLGDKIYKIAEEYRVLLGNFNDPKTGIFSMVVCCLQAVQFMAGDPVHLQYALEFQEAAEQIQLYHQHIANKLVFQLLNFSRFTQYQPELGIKLLQGLVKTNTMAQVFPFVEQQVCFQVIEPPAKTVQLSLELQEVGRKYNKLLEQYNLLKNNIGAPAAVSQDDLEDLKKELNNLTVKLVQADSKAENLQKINDQIAADKQRLQAQTENLQSTIELLQSQIKAHASRQEELQARKIQTENDLRDSQRALTELQNTHQALGENYRTLKTALSQIKTVIATLEIK